MHTCIHNSSSMSTTTFDDLYSDVLSLTLRHMDGPTLAAASSSSSRLRSVSSDPSLWGHLCLSTFPSLLHLPFPNIDHRNFFSLSFPYPNPNTNIQNYHNAPLPMQLISCIDLYHKGTPIFSRVVHTDTSSSWFLTSPFGIDALDHKDPVPRPCISPTDLTLSWIIIDPRTTRAVNVSSRQPVAIDRHWYTGETLVRFAVVLGGHVVSTVVTCGEDGVGEVRKVGMTVEDEDGVSVNGRESVVVMMAAMEERRMGMGEEGKVRERYEEYVRRRRERRERKMRREGVLDLFCSAFVGLVFLLFLMLLAFR